MRRRSMLTLGLVLALASSAWPAAAFAEPNTGPAAAKTRADVASSKAALDEAIGKYEAASERLASIEASLAAQTDRIDRLVKQQSDLQGQLGVRARTMYRTGPLGLFEVLMGSRTFNQFLSVWDSLLRLNRQDANTIAELKRTRAEVVLASENLLEQQMNASRELRALDAAKAKARRALAASTAAYEAYQREVAAREAERARLARARAASSSGGSQASAQSTGKPASAPQPTGTGAWKTALASHYGTGSYGIRLSSGVIVGPDSMIVAHKTLPFGTLVEFSYKGRVAVAKVADRGPYTPGREWDLGPGTTRVLGFRGVDKVNYRVIGR